MNYLLGTKKGMTQVFKDGKLRPVTVVHLPDNFVTRVETVQGQKMKVGIGIGQKKNPTQSETGSFKGLKFVPGYEWVVDNTEESEYKIGDKLNISDVVSEDFLVKVSAVSKSKGFAGVVKRHGFHGGPKTHGQSDRHRAAGAIGAGTDPGRVLKGKRMAGRMGGKVVTFVNKRILEIGDDYILVSGSLPGNNGTLIKIEVTQKTNEN
ncbi:50S ribosomal protein L3 [Candidatus Dojkabacteria bacterium]|nr:50S ribosomal protein L3 [Candidatus Dojkabacteria bacterium]